MPLKIVRADITKFPCDVVVNAANSGLITAEKICFRLPKM